MEFDAYGIPTIRCETAEEILVELDELNNRWRSDTWLYRGQNIDCPLLPTAMRPCKIIDDLVNSYHPRVLERVKSDERLAKEFSESFKQQYEPFRGSDGHCRLVQEVLQLNNYKISETEAELLLETQFRESFRKNHVTTMLHKTAERFIVAAFKELADHAGLYIPTDPSPEFFWEKPIPLAEKLMELNRNTATFHQDTSDVYSAIAFALARHHGLPTRLLDVTYRPLVAAYFSAQVDDLTNEQADRQILVWAINQRSLASTNIRVVKHRRTAIGFLQAQDGAFIYDTNADEKFFYAGKWAPLEDEVKTLAESENAFKFTLPFSKRKDLLDLLKLKGISRPTLMPSFDNVAQELKSPNFDLIRFAEARL